MVMQADETFVRCKMQDPSFETLAELLRAVASPAPVGTERQLQVVDSFRSGA